jgi:sugar transferase (PEP-CTERM/EpsH1 system associated)
VKTPDLRPLIAHVVYRFDVGGLENGVVNLINRLPADRYRHVVISLTEATRFRHRVLRDDVEFIELHKGPGHGVKLFPKLFRLFRRLRPAIVHTRNLAALEACIPAWLAGVPVRIHGEHGRDVGDLDGSHGVYRIVRRVHRPFVTHYVALSKDLEGYLVDAIGIPSARVTRIVNGVDTEAFTPEGALQRLAGCPFDRDGAFVFGTVGRLQAVKNQVLLARAFVRLVQIAPDLRERVRLIIIGEGRARAEIAAVLDSANLSEQVWMPGGRDDVAAVLRMLDVFVLPSLAEGISNTLLEAMGSGLPVIATRVGGNPELVDDGTTGTLVASDDVEDLTRAMLEYVRDPALSKIRGRASRARAERLFSLDTMVAQYVSLYDGLLHASRGGARAGAGKRAAQVTTGSH